MSATDARTPGAGRPSPLGATLEEGGVNFAVFSRHGTRAFVCLYDPADPGREIARHELAARTAQVFHAFVPDVGAGALYGFRVEGPYEPAQGHRFNPHKLLLDPYARALAGKLDLKGPVSGYVFDGEDEDLSFDDRDSAGSVPRSVVVSEDFDWAGEPRPARALADSLIYELHVKGFTRRLPGVPEELRGTYLGLAHPAATAHLRALGATAVELLPVFAFDHDGALADHGRVNYWGYNTLAYFAPHAGYALSKEPGAVTREFKQMVKGLHEAGLEVLLDVVLNHTFEGNERGPTLTFRGLDNASYYYLPEDNPRYVMQFSGCGNALDMRSPYALGVVLDCLRHWAVDMHVDGFRFDLATTLGREGPSATFDPAAGFFRAVHQDPVLSRLKLIAEPWDLGPDGYQVGRYPVRWSEWNGRFRDAARRFWMGDEDAAAELAARLGGSPDLFAPDRPPSASINFVTCHDGFTLHDLVTYGQKHNEDNGEDNRDGTDENLSWNCGVEGETDDPAIRALRERQKRDLLVTLLAARGAPMMTAGDELGRTQHGNNNAYCIDDERTWLDWNLDDARRALLGFTKHLVALRAQLPALRADVFAAPGEGAGAAGWYAADGTRLGPEDWKRRALQGVLPGAGGPSVLVLLNADAEPAVFTLPPAPGVWVPRVDTRRAAPPEAAPHVPGSTYELLGRSAALFVHA
ncbi:MAG TPA: glycogen debranching protein GlgX [Polyangia bacterium]|nr:glycogen debranching protein GlgX [Polyangia bacterium]